MRVGERVYRLLLRVLPRHFRREHQDDMIAWFRAHAADRADRGGPGRRIRFWSLLVADLARSALREHGPSGRPTASPPPNRAGGGPGDWLRDARFALRSLRRRPGFALLTVATLSLGVGAATTVYAAVHAVLIAPLPYPDADRVVRVGKVVEGRGLLSLSAPDVADLQASARSFTALAASRPVSLTLLGDGDPALVRGAAVSASFFDAMGRPPVLGRGWAPEADADETASVAVIAHGLWQRRWGGDPGVLGRTIRLNDAPFTVVGIMPRDFVPPEALYQAGTDLWVPLAFVDPAERADRRNAFLQLVGRLRPDVSLETANQELRVVSAALSRDHPEPGDRLFGVAPLREGTVGDAGRSMLPVLGAALLLLTLACVNVANLLLVRAAERRHELSVRTALGAGRGRLVRHLMVESLAIGALGGLGGTALAVAGVRLFTAMAPANLPRMAEVSVDARILAWAVTAALGTSILFGVLPALVGSGGATAPGVRGNRNGVRPSERWLRDALVASETALAIVLVAGAGLLANSLVRLHAVDLGFDPEDVAVISVSFADAASDDERIAFYDRVLDGVAAIPGVTSAGATVHLPLSGARRMTRIQAPGLVLDAEDDEQGGLPVNYQEITPGYLETLDVRPIAGRDFVASDAAGTEPVAIVNESLARVLAPDGDARAASFTVTDEPGTSYRIVGVVPDVRQHAVAAPVEPELFFAYEQRPVARMEILARGRKGDAALLSAMRDAVWTVRPDLPIRRSVSLEAHVADSLGDRRFFAALVMAFAALALAMAVVGVYGTLGFVVRRRTRELGVRIALGADRASIRRTVLGRALAMVGAGVVLGLGMAILATRALASMLFGVDPSDPATLAAAVGAVVVAAMAAAAVPAARAVRLDPVVSLRRE